MRVGAPPYKTLLLVNTVAPALPHGSVLVIGHAGITFSRSVAGIPRLEKGVPSCSLRPSTSARGVQHTIAPVKVRSVFIIRATCAASSVMLVGSVILAQATLVATVKDAHLAVPAHAQDLSMRVGVARALSAFEVTSKNLLLAMDGILNIPLRRLLQLC